MPRAADTNSRFYSSTDVSKGIIFLFFLGGGGAILFLFYFSFLCFEGIFNKTITPLVLIGYENLGYGQIIPNIQYPTFITICLAEPFLQHVAVMWKTDLGMLFLAVFKICDSDYHILCRRYMYLEKAVVELVGLVNIPFKLSAKSSIILLNLLHSLLQE